MTCFSPKVTRINPTLLSFKSVVEPVDFGRLHLPFHISDVPTNTPESLPTASTAGRHTAGLVRSFPGRVFPRASQQGWGAAVLWGTSPQTLPTPLPWRGGSRVLSCAGWTEMTQISALEHNFKISGFPNKTCQLIPASLCHVSMLGMSPCCHISYLQR